jgi:hypothetical protein
MAGAGDGLDTLLQPLNISQPKWVLEHSLQQSVTALTALTNQWHSLSAKRQRRTLESTRQGLVSVIKALPYRQAVLDSDGAATGEYDLKSNARLHIYG